MSIENLFFQAFTGMRAETYAKPGSITEMLQTLFPKSSTRGSHSFDTATAARQLKVSATTIRRWANGTQAPNKNHLNKLKRRVRNAPNTIKGRRNAIAAKKFANVPRPRGSSAVMMFHGLAGPSANIHDPSYVRNRYTSIAMSWDDYDNLMDTFVNKGEAEANKLFETLMNNFGMPPGYQIHTVDEIQLTNTSDRSKNNSAKF